MQTLVWMDCQNTDWQQLATPSLTGQLRNPASCVLETPALVSLNQTENIASRNVFADRVDREVGSLDEPKPLRSVESVEESSSASARSSGRDASRSIASNKRVKGYTPVFPSKPSYPGMNFTRSRSPPAVSPDQVERLSRDLDHAEKVSKNVTDRIEALKRKAAAVIRVL